MDRGVLPQRITVSIKPHNHAIHSSSSRVKVMPGVWVNSPRYLSCRFSLDLSNKILYVNNNERSISSIVNVVDCSLKPFPDDPHLRWVRCTSPISRERLMLLSKGLRKAVFFVKNKKTRGVLFSQRTLFLVNLVITFSHYIIHMVRPTHSSATLV